MPIDPLLPPSGIPWYKSQRVLGLCQASALLALIWTMNGLQSNVWDWKVGLAIPLLANVITVVRDMWSPTVVGPLAVMNRGNP